MTATWYTAKQLLIGLKTGNSDKITKVRVDAIKEQLTDTVTAIVKSSYLQELDLSDAGVSDTELEELCSVIKFKKSLKKLNLSKNILSKTGIGYIANVLNLNISLTHLDLSHNALTVQSTKIVAASLKTSSLKHLSLSSCGIGRLSGDIIAEGLRDNKSLETLDLSYNRIIDKAANSICEAILQHPRLRRVKLDHNAFGDKAIPGLLQAMQNPKLKILDVRGIDFAASGILTLAVNLEKNTTLEEFKISIRRLNMSLQDFKRFSVHIMNNWTLKSGIELSKMPPMALTTWNLMLYNRDLLIDREHRKKHAKRQSVKSAEVSVYEYALMSHLVYYEDGGTKETQDNEHEAKRKEHWATLRSMGWLLLTTSKELDSTSGYCGVAYVNKSKGQLVIAQRGTFHEDDFVTDLLLLFGKPDLTFALSHSFAQSVKAIAHEKYTGYEISYTGHSLGASLSEVRGYLDNRKVVSFDSPGARGILESISKDSKEVYSAPRANRLITTYVTEPNAANTLQPHAGKLVRIFPFMDMDKEIPVLDAPNGYWAGIIMKRLKEHLPAIAKNFLMKSRDFIQNVALPRTLCQHSMFGIVSVFEDEHKTGTPIKQQNVISWPTGPAEIEQYYRLVHRYYTLNLGPSRVVHIEKLLKQEDAWMIEHVFHYKVEKEKPGLRLWDRLTKLWQSSQPSKL